MEQDVAVNDNIDGSETAVSSSITSSFIKITENNNMGFIRKIIPDITFDGSSVASPSVLMTMKPVKNMGSGYNDPASESGESTGTVTRTSTSPIEAHTEQLYVRLRGRHMELTISNDTPGVRWQMGSPLIEVRPDGRR